MRKLKHVKLFDDDKTLLKENNSDNIGINFRSLLDGELALAIKKYDFSNYNERNKFIDELENRLEVNNWISLSDGTTFERTFQPNK